MNQLNLPMKNKVIKTNWTEELHDEYIKDIEKIQDEFSSEKLEQIVMDNIKNTYRFDGVYEGRNKKESIDVEAISCEEAIVYFERNYPTYVYMILTNPI